MSRLIAAASGHRVTLNWPLSHCQNGPFSHCHRHERESRNSGSR